MYWLSGGGMDVCMCICAESWSCDGVDSRSCIIVELYIFIYVELYNYRVVGWWSCVSV